MVGIISYTIKDSRTKETIRLSTQKVTHTIHKYLLKQFI